jgi:hypothetical protein
MNDDGTAGAVVETSVGRIDYDLKCHGCGYNLRTMALDGRCPECNEAVAVTLEVLDLGRAPEWLGRIRAGLALYPVAGVAVFAGVLLQTLLAALGIGFWREDMPLPLYLAGRIVTFAVLSGLPMILEWWYEWLVTTPREVGPCRRSGHRRVMRVVIVAQIISWLITSVLQGPSAYMVRDALDWLNVLATVVWSWCLWRWMETIVMPLRQAGLMKHIRLLKWVVPTLLVVRVASNYGINFYERHAVMRFGGPSPLEILGVFWGAILLLVTIWVFVILLMTRHRLAQVVSPPVKYLGDLKLAFVLLGHGMRNAGRWVKFAATYHGRGAGE